MEFKKITPNQTIKIIRCSDKKSKEKAFVLYSELKREILLDDLKKNFFKENLNKKVTITILKKGEKPKSRTFSAIEVPISTLKMKIKEHVIKYDEVVDVRSTKYVVVVKNALSSQIDNKKFSFNSKESFDIVLMKLRMFFEEKEIDVRKENIIFEKKENKKASHYITLCMSGTKERTSQPTKSFKINIPNYSSRQIIEMIQGGEE